MPAIKKLMRDILSDYMHQCSWVTALFLSLSLSTRPKKHSSRFVPLAPIYTEPPFGLFEANELNALKYENTLLLMKISIRQRVFPYNISSIHCHGSSCWSKRSKPECMVTVAKTQSLFNRNFNIHPNQIDYIAHVRIILFWKFKRNWVNKWVWDFHVNVTTKSENVEREREKEKTFHISSVFPNLGAFLSFLFFSLISFCLWLRKNPKPQNFASLLVSHTNDIYII